MTDTIEVACGVCTTPLNVVTSPHGTTHIHPDGPPADGHQPEPVPTHTLDTLARRCDFCGDPHPVWELTANTTTIVAAGHHSGLAQHYGPGWAACTTCETHIDTSNLHALVERATTSLGRAHHDARTRITELHAPFLHQRLPGRALITTTAWPGTTIHARHLPRIRDRLVHLWHSDTGLPPPLHTREPRHRIGESLQRARLYWIDPEFTQLAVHAAAQLPDLKIHPSDLPGDVLLAFAHPVAHNLITAASWTTTPHGPHLVCYRGIGTGLDNPTLQRLREHIGWLAPLPNTTTTGGPALKPQAAVVLACALLIQQAGHTEPAEIDKPTRRAYTRAGRPPPEVRIVRLPTRPTRRQTTGGDTGGRGPLRQREWVGEHWKQQPYGPRRAHRRRIYIAPYLRGPDNTPIRPSTTVRVLGTRTTQHEPASGP